MARSDRSGLVTQPSALTASQAEVGATVVRELSPGSKPDLGPVDDFEPSTQAARGDTVELDPGCLTGRPAAAARRSAVPGR